MADPVKFYLPHDFFQSEPLVYMKYWQAERESRLAMAECAEKFQASNLDLLNQLAAERDRVALYESLVAGAESVAEAAQHRAEKMKQERDAERERADKLYEVLKAYDGSRAIDQWDEHLMPSAEWEKSRRHAIAAYQANKETGS